MNKIRLLFLIGVFVAIGIFIFHKYGDPKSETLTLRGVITDSTNGCWIESGVCYVEIDNRWTVDVHYGLNLTAGTAGMNLEKGQVVGIETTEKDLGKQVEVYAKIVSDDVLSIYGDKDYYLKVVD